MISSNPSHLGLFEGIEDPGPNHMGIFESLEAGRERLPIIPEVVGTHPCRDHEVIPGDLQITSLDHLAIDVETLDLGFHDGHVLLPAEHPPKWGGDRTVIEHPGRHLIEQGLEEGVVPPIDERHIGVGTTEVPYAGDASKPSTHHHDPGAIGSRLSCIHGSHGISLEESGDPKVTRSIDMDSKGS